MPQRVLIVDADAAVREELRAVLDTSGYDTLIAPTVPAAMQMIREEPPDLVVTEVRVEGYNGLHLVAMAPRPVPAIVITSHPDPVIEGDARRLGADYLCRPIDHETVRAAVARRLSTAATAGVFLPARTEPRTRLPKPLPVLVDGRAGRVLDVSASGARIELSATVAAPFPTSLTLNFTDEQVTIPVQVEWHRQHSARCVCGVRVGADVLQQWQQLLASVSGLCELAPALP